MLSERRARRAGTELVIGTADGKPLARVPASVRDQIRYLWTRLQVHGGNIPGSIAVTSQVSGEGVSFTSHAVAVVLARTAETCLIEANWWSEGVPLEGEQPGLAGLLQSRCSLREALVPTSHPGLAIMPAGDLAATGQAVMASTEAMRSIIGGLRSRYSYVVLDLPAISVSATALSFASAAEATLLVARQRTSRIDHVERAVYDLRHTHLLGVIVNENKLSMPSFLQRRLLDA